MGMKAAFLYIGYAVLAFLVLCYLLFPEKTAGRIMSQRLNDITPELQVELSPVKLVPPLALKTLKPVLTLSNGKAITLDSLTLSLKPFALLSSSKDLDFRIEAFNGVVTGTVSVPSGALPTGMTLVSTFAALEINALHYASTAMDVQADFKLDGTLAYTPGQPLPGIAKGVFHLSNLRAELYTPLLEQLNLSEFKFTSVEIACTLQKNQLEIIRLDAKGEQLTMALTGSCFLNPSMEKSRLNLKGEIQPSPSFVSAFAGLSSVAMLFEDKKNGGIPFTLSGTVEKPIFKL
jgi:type II secretion system protein N